LFVANPQIAPPRGDLAYARPDDDTGNGETWREMLLRYNEAPGDNPLHLLPSCELYGNHTYRRLVDRLGLSNVFILSAGWGLIGASFLTPLYDITFSAAAEAYKRRAKGALYQDLHMLRDDCDDETIFFGGKDYLALFCALTNRLRGNRTVFYNSGSAPVAPGCSLKRFITTTRTNWHYECANRFLDGSIKDG
jgi:hypothetical protein